MQRATKPPVIDAVRDEREAVLVAEAREKEERRGVALQRDRIFLTGQVHAVDEILAGEVLALQQRELPGVERGGGERVGAGAGSKRSVSSASAT